MPSKKVEIYIMQFGQWIQMDLDRLCEGKIANIKAIVNQAGELLAENALASFAYKINMPYRVINEDSFKYPATWWDHFKESYFSYRLKLKFPVKYEIHRFQIRECYPSLKIPDAGKPVYFIHELTEEAVCKNS